ncbi:MAG TPA: NTP transferase domain-containing protein [Abditibacteriaceae bacterium]|nr:NTP transferase domain-containing protein [Abditibacteriaceae bacterium]
MNLAIIILAAGKGTRMESDLAKVLHPLCGKPLVAWALEATRALQPQRTILVVGHQAAAVEAAVRERFEGIEFVTQAEMRGTGHAVQQAEAVLRDFAGDIIVTCGDVPLINAATLQRLLSSRQEHDSAASMLVAQIEEPGSYGRVLCEADGRVTQIVEAKDAAPEVLAVQNVNAGTYCFTSRALWAQLGRINSNNKSGELYLTDVIGLLAGNGERVDAVFIDEREMTGINTRAQLENLEAQLRAEGVCAHV